MSVKIFSKSISSGISTTESFDLGDQIKDRGWNKLSIITPSMATIGTLTLYVSDEKNSDSTGTSGFAIYKKLVNSATLQFADYEFIPTTATIESRELPKVGYRYLRIKRNTDATGTAGTFKIVASD